MNARRPRCTQEGYAARAVGHLSWRCSLSRTTSRSTTRARTAASSRPRRARRRWMASRSRSSLRSVAASPCREPRAALASTRREPSRAGAEPSQCSSDGLRQCREPRLNAAWDSSQAAHAASELAGVPQDFCCLPVGHDGPGVDSCACSAAPWADCYSGRAASARTAAKLFRNRARVCVTSAAAQAGGPARLRPSGPQPPTSVRC